jgi:hypothetical protein
MFWATIFMQTQNNTQTCKQGLCTFFQICVIFFILPVISSVKAKKKVVQENILNLNFERIFVFLGRFLCGHSYVSLIVYLLSTILPNGNTQVLLHLVGF